MGEFDHWLSLQEWANESDKYENDVSSIRCTPYMKGMDSGLEEQLNYYSNVQNPDLLVNTLQLDLLLPIKLSSVAKEEVFEIPDSEAACGFKATLMVKNKFKIMGFTKILTPEMGEMEEAVQAFWKEVKADGRIIEILYLCVSKEKSEWFANGIVSFGVERCNNVSHW